MNKQMINQEKEHSLFKSLIKNKISKRLSFFWPLLSFKKRKSLIRKASLINIQKYINKVHFSSVTRHRVGFLLRRSTNKNLLNNLSFLKLNAVNKRIRQIIIIKITPNNTIITITNKKGKIKKNISAGCLGLKSSKKNYKIIYNLVINELITILKKEKHKKYIRFKFIAPKILRRKLVRRFKFYQRKTNIFETKRLLPYNGCRPAKMRRKKRKGLRIFKPKI